MADTEKAEKEARRADEKAEKERRAQKNEKKKLMKLRKEDLSQIELVEDRMGELMLSLPCHFETA